MTSVVSAKNGSIVAVTGSGIRFMSDSLIAFQPAIEEPSNISPSANASSSIMPASKVTCCHLPRGSVKRRSTYFTSLSLIAFRTSLPVFMGTPSMVPQRMRNRRISSGSDSVQPGFAGADADRFLDVGDEDLAVADAPGLRGAADRVDRLLDQVVGDHDLDLHLGQEVDDVFGAAIELGVALLAAEALGLGHRDALQPDLLKRLLHLVELERLDDGFDLLHCAPPGHCIVENFFDVTARFCAQNPNPARTPDGPKRLPQKQGPCQV